MKTRNIGHIILNGGNIKDLQNIISDFPSNPTTEYFMQLGYKKSTAQRYLAILSKNNNEEVIENESNNNVEDFTENCEFSNEDLNIVHSEGANFDNLLIDTCALSNNEGIKLIENAEKVTFIYSVLSEMDNKKLKKNKILSSNIATYSKKMLLYPEKYMTSQFSGCSNEKYVDNILLQYMLILPKQIRPTLLTQDKILADKASCFDLDYILLLTSSLENVFKKLKFGIVLIQKDNQLYVRYNGTYTLEIVHNGNLVKYERFCDFPVFYGDLLYLTIKYNKNITKHTIKI